MDPRLLRYYNEELRHLREMGAEFAQQFPKIASRLGVEGLEVTDPYVERLLEGFAFLAARIQLKLDAEFPRFTQRLLEIVYPHYLVPTPSMLIAQLRPQLGDAELAGGVTLPRGSSLTGRAGKAGATACEFRTAHDLTLWPIELTQAEYFSHAADLPLAAVPEWRRYRSGVRIRLRATAGLDFSRIAIETLRLHLAGVDEIAFRLHELLCGSAIGVLVMPAASAARGASAAGRESKVQTLAADCVRRAGFADDEALLPASLRGLEGHRLLQEYFAFPQRFLFVDLAELGPALRAVGGSEVEIVILADRADTALAQAVDAQCLALHCVPAVNLFEHRCDRIHVGPETPHFHVVPDRTRPMDFEVHSILDVQGHGLGVQADWRFLPLYSAFHTEDREHGAYYTLQREPRLMSAAQQRDGPRSSYLGTEVFVAVVDSHEAPFSTDLQQLSVRALCTNRDLPILMPIGSAGGDLVSSQAMPLESIVVIKGPSRPQSALREGNSAWKLINQLSLNHLSLTDTDSDQGAAALRQILRLYPPAADAAAQRQIDGLRSMRAAPVIRRLPMPGPISFGRGVALDVEVDDLAFEGGSAYLFACVIEAFVARHVSLNGFTQLALRTPGRGEIFRGAPRVGARPLA